VGFSGGAGQGKGRSANWARHKGVMSLAVEVQRVLIKELLTSAPTSVNGVRLG